jgi:hypothetical protein
MDNEINNHVSKGGGMLKAWIGYNQVQDFINILLLALCKKNS